MRETRGLIPGLALSFLLLQAEGTRELNSPVVNGRYPQTPGAVERICDLRAGAQDETIGGA